MCDSCKRDIRGVLYCEDCLAARTMTPGQHVHAALEDHAAGTPNPVVAALLGFIPGVGAMYCGDFLKGVMHVVIFGALVAAADKADFFGVLIAFWIFYMVFDAYKTAKARQHGDAPPDWFGLASKQAPVTVDVSPTAQRMRALPFGALFLIGMGVLFMLDNLGWFHFHWLGKLWPLILIGLGVYKLLQIHETTVCPCTMCRSRRLMGPAMLLTVGTMGLLAEFTRLGWGHTWPLFLIVIGTVRFLQSTGSRAGHIEPGAAPQAPAAGESIQS
jgi:hypothetical protein